MKKAILLIVAANFIITNVNSQITKGTWILGGNFNYSISKSSGTSSTNGKIREITINPTIGYFIIHKGVIGLKSKFAFSKEIYPQINGTEVSNSQKIIGTGPFIRYYFLPIENRVNLFSEVALTFEETISNSTGNTKSKFKALDYSVLGGVVIFLNTSVGLEFTVGYFNSKAIGLDARGEDLKFGIGFQIQLERDKEK